MDPGFSGFLLAIGGHSTTNIARRQRLAFSSQVFLLNWKGSLPVSLGNSSQWPTTFGVLVVLLTMSFCAKPKYFPQLKQSGTYVLKDCRVICT